MSARTRQTYLEAIAALKVETAPEYQPNHLGQGFTWCNLFVHNATKALEAEIPFFTANQQVEWLASIQGATSGWRELHGIDQQQTEAWAIDAAERGCPTVAAWTNPKGHGHVAMVVPSIPFQTRRAHIAQAGSHNFENVELLRGFGFLVPRYFTHD